MRKLYLLLIWLSFTASAQSIQSPEEYFGYEYGMKFHFHHQIVEYSKYLTQANPENTRLIPLGKTYEGREQIIVAFGSAENLNNLENIRNAHLQNIGMKEGNGSDNTPAIAMLSFNVHGNEAVNTEASIHVMHTLAQAGQSPAKDIFANTIIFVDPSVNPDGFDRYSQWYNRHIGKNPNANREAAEHTEPWPGGRVNHYMFDLNRDLAWQTQKESQQRMAFYNSWLPHYHGDFHEMGAESNNFFAPSAKPFHEDINAHQRKYQNIFGDYHKEEFDKQGWLYFTKTSFDLLYPSYGDTYPTYNGAIAMTYEQAGSGQAGLAYARTDGDTLTLANRIDHVYSTAFAAMRAVSEHADNIIAEQKKYFNDPVKNGYGTYKSFVLKGKEADKTALTRLLDQLEIKYSYADRESSLKGYSYQTKKDEGFKLEKEDLIVNTYQPKGVLTKILFEPETFLEDSVTYDIDSWALPYVYGLNAYALGQKLEGQEATNTVVASLPAKTDNLYALILRLKSFEDYKFMAAAMQAGLKVRQQSEAFSVNGKDYPAGTIILPKQGNPDFENKIAELFKEIPVHLETMESGMVEQGADLGRTTFLGAPRVGIMIGDGVRSVSLGDIWHFFDQQLDYPSTLLDVNNWNRFDKSNYDVLIFPSGRYSLNDNQLKELGSWIQAGGRLVLMESAISSFAGKEGFSLKMEERKPTEADPFKAYGSARRDWISNNIPGAIYEVKLDNTHPLGFGYDKNMHLLIHGRNNYNLLDNGWNVGVLGQHKSGFVGANIKDKMENMPVFAVQDRGRGKVVYLTNSPIFRSFWYSGKALFANSVFFVK